MEKEILEMISTEFPDIDFTSSETLAEDGMLDSLTLAGIITLLSVKYEISIPYEELSEENFNSVSAMADMVRRLKDA